MGTSGKTYLNSDAVAPAAGRAGPPPRNLALAVAPALPWGPALPLGPVPPPAPPLAAAGEVACPPGGRRPAGTQATAPTLARPCNAGTHAMRTPMTCDTGTHDLRCRQGRCRIRFGAYLLILLRAAALEGVADAPSLRIPTQNGTGTRALPRALSIIADSPTGRGGTRRGLNLLRELWCRGSW